MMRKTLAFMIGAGFVLAAGGVSAQTAVIKMGSHTPPKGAPVKRGIGPWMRAIEKDAAGTLKFQEFWGGQLSRSPRKQYELMMNGIQDASPILPSYTQKLFPDFGLFALPHLFRSAEEGTTAQWRMFRKGLIGGLEKVYVAAIYNNGNSAMHFSKTIKSAKGIKGLKIRAAGPGEAAVIKLMGGIPVGMSITQVAQSLNRGVIQGTLSGWSAVRIFKISPLIKTHYDEPLGVRSFFLGITKKVYDRLPEKAKQAIKKNSGLKMGLKMSKVFDNVSNALRKKAAADSKKNIITVSKAQWKKRAAMFKPIHDRWLGNNPDRRKKYDALIQVLADIRKGS